MMLGNVDVFQKENQLTTNMYVAGKYSSTLGSTNCSICEVGKYSVSGGSIDCKVCDAGKYSYTPGMTVCMTCPSGKYSTTSGASSQETCQDCGAGKYASTEGNNSPSYCVACSPGNWSFSGAMSCFSLMIVVIGEWEAIATSAGVGASQSISYTKGITRTAGFEQTDAWASSVSQVVGSGVAQSYTQGYEYMSGQSTSTEQTQSTGSTTGTTVGGGASGGFSLFGIFSFGASANGGGSWETQQSSSATTGTEQSSSQTSSSQNGIEYQKMLEIGSQMAREHASTISIALEENEEQTISQTWGSDSVSGAGVVWQFKYKIEYIYGSNQIGTPHTVLTDNNDNPPCCLPGTFADHNNPHGPCLPNYPCACSVDVCSREVQTSSSTGRVSESVIIEQITNHNQIHVHMNVRDLQIETNSKLDKISSRLDVLSETQTNMTAKTKCSCDEHSAWNYQMSVAWSSSSRSAPLWNQSQYKYCQPLFDSWRDMRRQLKAGSLRVLTGGLGKLLVEGEYEVWICVHKDPCALGGDFFFCYVLNERSNKFVSWDQNYNLHLFQSESS